MSDPIHIESKAFILLIMLFHECKKNSNVETLEKNISNLSKKITNENYKSEKLLRALKNKSKNEFRFCYAKLNTEIQRNNFEQIQLKGENLNRIKSLFNGILLKRYPNNNILKGGIFSLIEDLQGRFIDRAKKESHLINSPIVEEFKNIFSNSKWFCYHHEYESNTPLNEITRLVLEFKDLDEKTKNTVLYEKKPYGDFEGSVEILPEISHTSVIINLKRIKSTPKDLQIRFILPEGIDDDSIFLGQYIDFEKGETIIAGTFILENTKGHFSRQSIETEMSHKISSDRLLLNSNYLIVKRALVYNSGWEHYIPKEIASYLSNKWMNFSKTKTNIGSLSDLKKFLIKQEQKHFQNSKFNNFIEYDVFLLTPMIGIPKEERIEMFKQVDKAFFEYQEIDSGSKSEALVQCFKASKFLFESLKIEKIYYPPRYYNLENQNIFENLDTNEILRTELVAMQQSRFVVFIMHKSVCSSVLVKVGWAIQMEKPVFVFQTGKYLLPKLLTKDYKKIIRVINTPKKISQIPGYLKIYFSEFFKYEM